jgi:O-antigen/teichoic acid export membrane protein
LGRGRPVVVEFIELGLFITPYVVFAQMLQAAATGEERWSVTLYSRLIMTVGSTLVIVGLSLVGELTVQTVSATYIGVGAVATIPFLVMLRPSLPWRFRGSVAREALRFGGQSWLATIATVSNNQLDQVLMAGLVPSRQLGLYAAAATVANVGQAFVGALAIALVPRVARGDRELAAKACRVTIAGTLSFGVAMAVASPVLVSVVFGDRFAPMIPMLRVLLVAGVASGLANVLSSIVIADGNPGAAARAQAAGFVITVPGLAIALPLAGGMGAALVSLASYATAAILLTMSARQSLKLPLRRLVVPTLGDATWLIARVTR